MRPPPSLSQFHRYPVTAGTALLAIAASLAFWAGWKVDPLFEDYHILAGQYWRLLTSVLPHVNVFHLAFNVYWTWVFGTLIEQVFGHVRTLLLFLLFAATSNAAEFAILHGGIGLSGVGYGLFGLLWVLSARDRRFRDAVDPQTITLFVIWFFVCIALTVSNIMPVANIAHGMGTVTGGIAGFVVVEKGAARKQVAALLTVLCIATGVAVSVGRPYVNLSDEGSMDYAGYGYDLLLKGQNQKAETQLKNALHIDPRNALAWYNLGCADQRLGKIPDASHAFNRAAQLEPENTQYKDAAAEYPEAGSNQ